MANIQLAVMCVALWAFLPCQARDCLSRCCNLTEIEQAGDRLTPEIEAPTITPDPQDCKASSSGQVNERSTSPWRYEKDENSSRFPFRLWQARCNCHRCITLKPCGAVGKDRNETCPFVNSVPVVYNTIVFIRKPCDGEPGRFSLVPQPYPVSVSCTCVIRKASLRFTTPRA